MKFNLWKFITSYSYRFAWKSRNLYIAFKKGLEDGQKMALFTDTVTIYNKISDSEWKRSVVNGVQWLDKTEKQNNNGKISVVRYVSVTFPEGTYENLSLNSSNEEDCIIYGEVNDTVEDVKGKRITDLMKKYPKSGTIKSVNDNYNRYMLKNIKVVVA